MLKRQISLRHICIEEDLFVKESADRGKLEKLRGIVAYLRRRKFRAAIKKEIVARLQRKSPKRKEKMRSQVIINLRKNIYDESTVILIQFTSLLFKDIS